MTKPPMSHPHSKLLDRIDTLPVHPGSQLHAVVNVTRDQGDVPQDLLKEYTPGEAIHGCASLFNGGGAMMVKSVFVVMEGMLGYQRLGGWVTKRMLRMDMDVVEDVSVPAGFSLNKRFVFVVPDLLIGNVGGEEEVLVSLPPSLGSRGTGSAAVGEAGFAVGNGMGGPIVLDDLSCGVLVEYRIRCIAIGVDEAIVGEAEYPVRIVPSWRLPCDIAWRSVSVDQLIKAVQACIKEGGSGGIDIDEKVTFGQAEKEVEVSVRNWGMTSHLESGLLSMRTADQISVGYSTAPMIEKFNGIITDKAYLPIVLNFSGSSSPPKILNVRAKLQTHTITSSLALPIKIRHQHLDQINIIRRAFAKYHEHFSDMMKVCPVLISSVGSLASLEKKCITTESFPEIGVSRWIKTQSEGWQMSVMLDTRCKQTLVPDFQWGSVARLYTVEVEVETKRETLVMSVPLVVRKTVAT